MEVFKEIMGVDIDDHDLQSKIVEYFTEKFPNLLDHIWNVYYQWSNKKGN